MFVMNEDLARVHANDLRLEARRASQAGRHGPRPAAGAASF